MAYNNAIPQPNDRIKDSQSQILQNFSQIFTVFGLNHANFNTANAGKHNIVSMPVQAVNPVTNATEVALYSKTGAVTGVPELAFRRNNSGLVVEMTAGLLAQTGWCYLPSGLLMKWGATASATFPVNLNLIGPAYASLYNVQSSTRVGGPASYASTLNNTTPASLNIGIVGASIVIYWVTLGV